MFRLTHILSSVDPMSPNPALAQALCWARQHRATLHAVYVPPVEKDELSSPASRSTCSEEVRRCVEENAHRLDLSLDAFALQAVVIEASSCEAGLLRYATEHAIDLIVPALSAATASSPLRYDATRTGLLQQAPCPVLVPAASSAPSASYRRLLAPIDFSRSARRGVEYARSLAARHAASLDVLHVLERPRYLALNATDMLSLSDARLPERKALRRIQRLVAEAAGPDIAVRFHIAHGNPADEIAAFASAHGNDLLVLPSHDSTPPSKRVPGTTTMRLLRHLALPLLLVNPRAEAALQNSQKRSGYSGVTSDANPDAV